MTEQFAYDVFLSYAHADRDTVLELAERFRRDGLKVWFDEWIVKSGDSIDAKVEEGLEQSRVLVLCLSEAAVGRDWPMLESGTFRFRDPLNRKRRFIPLRLDATLAKGSLAQFPAIDWRIDQREREYSKLLEACRPEHPVTTVAEQTTRDQFLQKILSLGHTETIRSVSYCPDGRRALSGSGDTTVRVWDVATGVCERVLEGHSNSVGSVSWSPDGRRALSGSGDATVRVWDVSRESANACLKDTRASSGAYRGVQTADAPCPRRMTKRFACGTL